MSYEDSIDDAIHGISAGIARCFGCPVGIHAERGLQLAGQQSVASVLNDLIGILFPGCHGRNGIPEKNAEETLRRRLSETALELRNQIVHALAYEAGSDSASSGEFEAGADEAMGHLMESLPVVLEMLQKDVIAGYEGDPAARSIMEVVLSYPCFKAIAAHRIAHELYKAGIPLIPRMMSEDAHARTGIDIHPGAVIGEGFFIDHGTGVVIGETCVIGNRVKVYQGVTLGALSFPVDARGNPLKGIKRHPNVEDDVTIYGGATILGDITIGAGSVIGGNVWLTHSVPPGSRVYNRQPTPLVRQADGEWRTADGPWNDTGAGI